MEIVIPKKFEILVKPNYTEEERRRLFPPEKKVEVRRRLLKGEEIDDSDIGLKTIILKGGRISGKTQTDDYATIPLFFGDKGDIWYCRSEENTLRRSVVASLEQTIHNCGFTLSNRRDTDFKVSYSPFEITCNHTGNKCQFFAINKDINRTKAMIPPSGRLKKIVLEEANEPDGPDYIKALRSTYLRFCDEMTKAVYRYNPPPGLNNWANIYYPSLAQSGATIIHSTWEDIAELLEPVVIADILKMKRDDPVHYAYWYGGEAIALQGLVIWAFERSKHLISLATLFRRRQANIYYQPIQMFYGVDSGIKRDATAVSAWALYPDGEMIKLGTWYVDIKEMLRKTHRRGYANSDQAKDMALWHKEFKSDMAKVGIQIPDPTRERWCFDGAAITQDLMFEFTKHTGFDGSAVTNKDVERDVERLNNSYLSGALNILDVPSNAISIKEMESFVRDEEGEIPDGQSDHTIDADKYALYDYYYNFMR